jgi:transposase
MQDGFRRTLTKKNGHGRRKLPDSLPRVRQTHVLNDTECTCAECGTLRVKIGEEVSEQLDYQPASLFVVEHVRFTYACPKCQGNVTTADRPAQPIAKGLPGPGLLAQIITRRLFAALSPGADLRPARPGAAALDDMWLDGGVCRTARPAL